MADERVPSSPGALMADEICQQPDVLARQMSSMRDPIRRIGEQLASGGHRFVLLAARGTSDHAALYAKYLVETKLGLPAGLASPSTLTSYRSQPDLEAVLWIAISQSGESPDLVESTLAASSAGATTLALTNAAGSPLAASSDLHIDIGAGPERSVAATKTYTAQLQALWLLFAAWRGDRDDAVRAVPGAIEEVLNMPQVTEVAERYRFVDRLVATGRGFSYPTAREAALKLMETSYVGAQAFSGADLMHGPLAMIDEDGPVIVIAPEGVGGRLLRPVIERLSERKADLLILGDPAVAVSSAARTVLPLPGGLEESLSPIVQIVPLQQLALRTALARHLNPDEPRGLRKVTETR